MVVFLIAAQIVKVGKPGEGYRAIYDEARLRYAGAVHNTECIRCGGKKSPAPEGSALRPTHQHAASMRLVGKAILRDLWIAAA